MAEYRNRLFAGDDVTDNLLRGLESDREMEQLTIWGGPLTNDRLEPLSRLTWLKGLVLGEMPIDDGVFRHLREMKQLELLILAYTNITGDFGLVPDLPLRDVRLEGSKRVGDSALQALSVFPTLRNLEVHITGVTDKGLEYLRDSALEVLWVGPHITNAGMKTIATMKRLKHLDVCAAGVTDEGVGAIAELQNLEVLWLSQCRITDASVDTLCALPKLKELAIGGTAITAAGIERLRQSHSLVD